MADGDETPMRLRWARRRFSIIGPLLAAPPADGELRERLELLARQVWAHPTTEAPITFSLKTIERWFYLAREAPDPVTVLARRVPNHAGIHRSITTPLAEAILAQHRDHPRWTYRLHHINLEALAKERPELGVVPTYSTVRRFMKSEGLYRGKRRRRRDQDQFLPREKRGYEVDHVHGLWHLDFHQGSRAVLLPTGQWKKPQLLGVLDDRSRLCCHLQWYLNEDTEALVHGFSQAIQKRKLCRALLSDNGSAMLSAEFTEGLERLGIVHHTTLPETPEQNGKQESFWGQLEGRCLPMLEGVADLTLDFLNHATQAWVEGDYNHKVHSEIKEPPITRYLRGPDVGRDSPSSDALRRAFKTEVSRKHRLSDGTVTVEGVRFEVPSAYRALRDLRLRIARWDLSTVDLVDPRTGKLLATLLPIDKSKNAERSRRVLDSHLQSSPPSKKASGIAPYMRQLMSDYAATGMPPGFIPHHKQTDDGDLATTDHIESIDDEESEDA